MVFLGVFAVNRMTTISQASLDMGSNQLPSVKYLSNMTENVLRLRIQSSRIFINRDPTSFLTGR